MTVIPVMTAVKEPLNFTETEKGSANKSTMGSVSPTVIARRLDVDKIFLTWCDGMKKGISVIATRDWLPGKWRVLQCMTVPWEPCNEYDGRSLTVQQHRNGRGIKRLSG